MTSGQEMEQAIFIQPQSLHATNTASIWVN